MEGRIEVYTPEEISSEELARSSSACFLFGRSLLGRSFTPPPLSQQDEAAFSWVFVALMSDRTLRLFTNEMMDEEFGRLKLDHDAPLEVVAPLESPPDTYEHAFRIRPNRKSTSKQDSWVLCPDSTTDSEDW